MKSNKRYLTQSEVLKATGIPYYRLEYLIRLNAVPVIQRGKGNARLFPVETVEIIQQRKKDLMAQEGE